MDSTSIIVTVISTLFGGGIGAFLTYKLGNRKQDESEFSSLVNEYKQLHIKQKEHSKEQDSKIQILQDRIHKVEKLVNERDIEINQLRNQLMIFESSHTDVPIPIWLKDTSGVMLFVNNEYEHAMLNPLNLSAIDYIGKTDIDVWGEEIGNRFREHDKKVMRAKKALEFEETWKGSSGETWRGTVIKYPRFINNRSSTVIGIGGIIVERWKEGQKKN